MKNLKLFFIILCLMPLSLKAGILVKLDGCIKDAQTQKTLENVNIRVTDSSLGSASDINGKFSLYLPEGIYLLQATHIGYLSVTRKVFLKKNSSDTINIFLKPALIRLKESIAVYGRAEEILDANRDKWLNSTDDIMRRFDGVTLMRRANFALEPSIRGLSYGQISTTIDGMKIFHACVDRMDPATSYVEVENLKQMDIKKGAYDLSQPSVGGTLNLLTSPPQREFNWSSKTELGFESTSFLRRMRSIINHRTGANAFRGSISVKKADSYYAGKHTRIHNSGYSKQNAALKYVRSFDDTGKLTVSYIGDFAQHIGYPALLMDATKTLAHISSLQYDKQTNISWLSFITAKLYYNHIRHWMDDYARDVVHREVMANMNMPMYGSAITFGGIISGTFGATPSHYLKVTLDYYRLTAFADMKMLSIFPNTPPAYIINIADARLNNLALVVDYNQQLAAAWRMRTNLRLDYASRDIFNQDGKRALQAFWTNQKSANRKLLPSMSLSLEWQANKRNMFNWSVADAQRMPSHMEAYSFFIYNLLDGYFYTGNPQLKPEQSIQTDFRWRYRSPGFSSKFALFFNHLNNYISGKKQTDEFKIYENYNYVNLWGFEWSWAYTELGPIVVRGNLSYTNGYNKALKEPLPYMPPLAASVSAAYQGHVFWLELSAVHNNAQYLIAHKSTREDTTPSFNRFDLRARYIFSKLWELKFGIENITDKLYHEHLSINNLPSPGRNFYMGVDYNWHSR